MTIQKWSRTLVTTLAAVVALGWAGTTWALDDATRDAVIDAKQALGEFKKADPGLKDRMKESIGFAVFPNVTKGGIGLGGARGNGVLFEKGKAIGTTTMTQVTVGAQLGAQQYSEMILFKDADTLKAFKNGNFRVAAQASAVAAERGASANARYEGGVQVYTMTKSGMMFEASVGGQRFDFRPFQPEAVSVWVQ
jgi:lipid-binding SYLF domain-containing protein